MARYVNPIPATYDNTTIKVDTNELAKSEGLISLAVLRIGEYLNAIQDVMDGLRLNWLGQASDAQQAYTEMWNNIMAILYGQAQTESDGTMITTLDDGALSLLTAGLTQAVNNYNANEQAVIALFSGSGGSSSNSCVYDVQNQTDTASDPISSPAGIQQYLYHTTAVNEDF